MTAPGRVDARFDQEARAPAPSFRQHPEARDRFSWPDAHHCLPQPPRSSLGSLASCLSVGSPRARPEQLAPTPAWAVGRDSHPDTDGQCPACGTDRRPARYRASPPAMDHAWPDNRPQLRASRRRLSRLQLYRVSFSVMTHGVRFHTHHAECTFFGNPYAQIPAVVGMAGGGRQVVCHLVQDRGKREFRRATMGRSRLRRNARVRRCDTAC